MRLVTWNCCRGTHLRNTQLLNGLAPDIAVLQECARPTVESDQCLWFGDNPLQGIAVQASGAYRLRRLPALENVPKFVIPVEVGGPVSFTLIAVWSKGRQEFPYVEAVFKAVDMYRGLITSGPTVLVGDLNSNVLWDRTHPRESNHSALVALLGSLGLVSAYHAFFQESHGAETRPTYYFQWNEARRYHIDYCFVPNGWIKSVQRVEVGNYVDWIGNSDHRPITVQIGDLAGR